MGDIAPAASNPAGHPTDASAIAFLDHYQAEQFGLYWTYYPKHPLQGSILHSLLATDHLLLPADALHPEEIRTHAWAREFEAFERLGTVEITDPETEISPAASLSALTTPELYDLNVPDFQDVFYLDYCVRHGLPFAVSAQRLHNLPRIAALSAQALGTPCGSLGQSQTRSPAGLASWLLEIEVPALEVRSARLREEVLLSSPPIIAYRAGGRPDWDFTALPLAQSTLQTGFFISPAELVETFEARAQIAAIRRFLHEYADRCSTKAELADVLKASQASLALKLGRADAILTILDVCLSWVPFIAAGSATAKLLTNRWLKQHHQWRFFLAQINERVRSGAA